MPKKFSCVAVGWDYAYDLCRDVREEMRKAAFVPEVVVGVARGGWYLARVLCDFFLLKDLVSLKTEHWGLTATVTGAAEMKFGLDDAAKQKIRGRRVLVADDVTDTGDSVKLVVEYLESREVGAGAKEVRTAVLHHKTSSPFVPDFYGELVKDWKWVVYPWSVHEDLMDLVAKVVSKSGKAEPRGEEGRMSLSEIRAALKEEFDFYVPFHLLREVLENMLFHGKIKIKKEKEEKEEGEGEGGAGGGGRGKEVWLLR